MKSETLQLLDKTSQDSAQHISRALNAVNGVHSVRVALVSNSVHVDYDDDLTSTQELRASLQGAGFSVKKPVHGEDGVCCGSCGS
jgi:CCGSCS motif protein